MWGDHVHLAGRRDVLPTFRTMCLQAQWHEKFNKIYLLYLSPEGVGARQPPAIASSGVRVHRWWVSRAVAKGQQPPTGSRERQITVIYAGTNDLSCLRDLLWPERSSSTPL